MKERKGNMSVMEMLNNGHGRYWNWHFSAVGLCVYVFTSSRGCWAHGCCWLLLLVNDPLSPGDDVQLRSSPPRDEQRKKPTPDTHTRTIHWSTAVRHSVKLNSRWNSTTRLSYIRNGSFISGCEWRTSGRPVFKISADMIPNKAKGG